MIREGQGRSKEIPSSKVVEVGRILREKERKEIRTGSQVSGPTTRLDDEYVNPKNVSRFVKQTSTFFPLSSRLPKYPIPTRLILGPS